MDQISNMIIMLKNSSLAGRPTVAVPYSRVKNSIAECLRKEGYIGDFSKKIRKNHPILEIELVYKDKHPKINNVERVSKQSRRVYLGVKEIFPVKSGSGILILSTPKGILSGSSAKKEQVGGEVLFKIF